MWLFRPLQASRRLLAAHCSRGCGESALSYLRSAKRVWIGRRDQPRLKTRVVHELIDVGAIVAGLLVGDENCLGRFNIRTSSLV